jgi:hypothetical protein
LGFLAFIATTNGFSTTTMLKKRSHNNYYNQTNPSPQPKPETNLKKQPEKTLVHTKLLQQQPKRNTQTNITLFL